MPSRHNSRRVVIVSGYPLTQTPRVVKEADALAELGWDVHLLGATSGRDQTQSIERRLIGRKWTHHNVLNAEGTLRDRYRWNRARVYRKLLQKTGFAPRTCFQYEIHHDLAALKRYAMDLRGDFYSLHMEAALWVADALEAKGIRYAYDLEDWHSENTVHGESTLPYEILRKQERKVLRNSQFVTTTSEAMAEAVSAAYEIPVPRVVSNSFPDGDFEWPTPNKPGNDTLSIAWFSQTIGPGRGIEILIEAARRMRGSVEIHLRGRVSDDYREQLRKSLGERDNAQIVFHSLCDHSQLGAWLSLHDIGLASELPNSKNQDLTISNKILQYLQSGLFVLATNTTGQSEVAAKVGDAVEIISNDPCILAQRLDQLSMDASGLQALKSLARERFEAVYDWRFSKSTIQSLFQAQLNSVCEPTLHHHDGS